MKASRVTRYILCIALSSCALPDCRLYSRSLALVYIRWRHGTENHNSKSLCTIMYYTLQGVGTQWLVLCNQDLEAREVCEQ